MLNSKKNSGAPRTKVRGSLRGESCGRIETYFLLGAAIGVVVGMFATAIGGIVLYKTVKKGGWQTRYQETKSIISARDSSKSQAQMGFNFSFENKGELDVFEKSGNVALALSKENATNGSRSLKLTIPRGSGYPGLTWEVFGGSVQNWASAKYFHLDVYNDTKDQVDLDVKFKSGSKYPKKSFSHTARLRPSQINNIKIPITRIAEKCNTRRMSYVKLFVAAPKKDITLFIDNMGVAKGGATEKKVSAKSRFIKEFNLSFEKSADLGVFEASDGAYTEQSKQNATHGKNSLMAVLPAGYGYPGLAWEVFGKHAQNWSKAKDFHFDVYYAGKERVDLQVKFKSGRNYPKKDYTYPAELAPSKLNHVSIPLSLISPICDISEISYVKLFVVSPKRDVVLFFDNMGTGTSLETDGPSETAVVAIAATGGFSLRSAGVTDIGISVTSSLDKVFQDGKTLLEPLLTESVQLMAAKNEYESFQIVVSPNGDALKSVSLEISDLVDEKTGSSIEKSNVTWRVVGYVQTEKPYYPTKFVGMWPDPLLPAQETSIDPDSTQPFWVTVYVPKETQAGTYKGNIRVLSESRSLRDIPVSIRVLDFTLPLTSHLKTAFDFYPHIMRIRHPRNKGESDSAYSARLSRLSDKYIINMLKHRMNPILNVDTRSEYELGKVDKYRLYGLNNFAVGRKGGSFENNWPKTDTEIEKLLPLYRKYGEDLKINKMLDYHYVYTSDEAGIGKPFVQKVCSMVHRAHPELKNLVTDHGFWEPEKLPGWGDDIDIWCFMIDRFNEARMRALKERGIEIWTFISGPSGTGTPNLAIDFDSIDYRIIPWLCWKYDIKGVLYWSVNWWPDIDPFKSAANIREWKQNGNGLLYYPGNERPIESLRLDVFRDGMEDYEYLVILADRLNALKDQKLGEKYPEIFKKTISLLTVDKPLASSLRMFTKNKETLFNRRKEIAEAIEEINGILTNEKI